MKVCLPQQKVLIKRRNKNSLKTLLSPIRGKISVFRAQVTPGRNRFGGRSEKRLDYGTNEQM